jgi:fused signal recognition particle receptor
MNWDDPALVAGGIAALVLIAVVAIAFAVRARRRRRAAAAGAAAKSPSSWLAGLERTRGGLGRRLLEAWGGSNQGDAYLERVEEILLGSDVGVKATRAIVERLRPQMRSLGGVEPLRELLRSTLCEMLTAEPPAQAAGKPHVILVVGVNGVGKTTTIGKLAHRYKAEGQKVLVVAGDTFRAAATEQLALWAERVDVDIVKHQAGADPSAVAFDGMQAAQARGADVVIVDTAGRLHVKTNLMEEVKKVARTIGRQVPAAPHEVLLVIDATTGQNAINQARVFHQALGISGVVLTKLDGTAKGGVALAIRSELGLPIRYVGLGERAEDLTPFDAASFVEALLPAGEVPNAA